MQSRSSPCEVELALPESQVYCRFDRENISRALLNLLQNAEQAMPGGGRIRVSLHGGAGLVKLRVSDQGKSVPEEIRDRIFTPFFSTREGGTGLGLAQVKKIVEAHRGTIELEDQNDCGATFTITLRSDSSGTPRQPVKEKLQ
jgi:two-component system sensor histidine kinase AtoS